VTRGREIAVASVALGLVAVAAFWPVLGETGFYNDDYSYPVLPGSRLRCGRSGVEMSNSNDVFERKAARYADAVFVDVAGRRRLGPAGPRACRQAARLTAPPARDEQLAGGALA
jgi:hypothetical protein